MNNVKTIENNYLWPNISTETVLISNRQSSKILYLLNYKGISYRIFQTKTDLDKCVEGKYVEGWNFQSDEEVDSFLFNLHI